MGGFGDLGADYATSVTVPSLPSHSMLRVQLVAYAIDHWATADTYSIIVDDVTIATFDKGTGTWAGLGAGLKTQSKALFKNTNRKRCAAAKVCTLRWTGVP